VMFADEKSLFPTNSIDFDSATDIRIASPFKNFEKNLLDPNTSFFLNKFQQKRFIQTKAQKGASQISKFLCFSVFFTF